MTRARDVANLIGSGNYSSTTFTATAGQTAFTISHTQGFIQVFMNGLLLDETVDYTSNGSAVTLTSGAAAGDEIEVVAYNTFSVGDALNQAAADTRYVNATGDTMTGTLNVNGLVNITNTYSSDTTEQLRVSDNTGSKLDFFGHANGTKSIQAYADDGSTFYNLNLQPLGGYVTTPSQPFIECEGNSNSTYSYSQDQVIAHWSNKTTPVGITRSGGRFTVPVTGKYLFCFTLYSYVAADGHYRNHIKINGSLHSLTQLEVGTGMRLSNGPYDFTLMGSHILNMSANDYVEIIASDAQQMYRGADHNALSMVLLG